MCTIIILENEANTQNCILPCLRWEHCSCPVCMYVCVFVLICIVAKRPTFWRTTPQICLLSRGPRRSSIVPQFPKLTAHAWLLTFTLQLTGSRYIIDSTYSSDHAYLPTIPYPRNSPTKKALVPQSRVEASLSRISVIVLRK